MISAPAMMAFNTKAVTNVLVEAVCELAIFDADVLVALGCDVVVVDDLGENNLSWNRDRGMENVHLGRGIKGTQGRGASAVLPQLRHLSIRE